MERQNSGTGSAKPPSNWGGALRVLGVVHAPSDTVTEMRSAYAAAIDIDDGGDGKGTTVGPGIALTVRQLYTHDTGRQWPGL